MNKAERAAMAAPPYVAFTQPDPVAEEVRKVLEPLAARVAVSNIGPDWALHFYGPALVEELSAAHDLLARLKSQESARPAYEAVAAREPVYDKETGTLYVPSGGTFTAKEDMTARHIRGWRAGSEPYSSDQVSPEAPAETLSEETKAALDAIDDARRYAFQHAGEIIVGASEAPAAPTASELRDALLDSRTRMRPDGSRF